MLRHLLHKIKSKYPLLIAAIGHGFLLYSLYSHKHIIPAICAYLITSIYADKKAKDHQIRYELNLREEVENELRIQSTTKPLIDQIYDAKRLELTKLYATQKAKFGFLEETEIIHLKRAIDDIGDGWDETMREKKMRIYWPEEFPQQVANSTNEA